MPKKPTCHMKRITARAGLIVFPAEHHGASSPCFSSDSFALSTETTCSLSTDWYVAAGQTHVPIGTLVGTQFDSGTLFGLAALRELSEMSE